MTTSNQNPKPKQTTLKVFMLTLAFISMQPNGYMGRDTLLFVAMCIFCIYCFVKLVEEER